MDQYPKGHDSQINAAIRDVEKVIGTLHQCSDQAADVAREARQKIDQLPPDADPGTRRRCMEEVVPKLLRVLESNGTSIRSHTTVLHGIVEILRKIDNELRRSASETAEREKVAMKEKQIIRVAQAAYSIANKAEWFVFRDDYTGYFTPMNLKQIEDHPKNKVQQERWETFLRLMKPFLSKRDLLETDRTLRSLRFEAAHGNEAELETLELDTMKEWVDDVVTPSLPRAAEPVKNLFDALSRFSFTKKPFKSDISVEKAAELLKEDEASWAAGDHLERAKTGVTGSQVGHQGSVPQDAVSSSTVFPSSSNMNTAFAGKG